MTTRSITGAGVPYPSSHTLAYDAANRLISATPQPSGSATTYGYDGHDRRVASTPPGGVTKLTMYSKAGQLLSEIRTNGSARVNYVYLGRHLLARVPYNSFGTGGGGLGSAPPKLFQHTDGLGTPIAVTDASGVLQGQRSVYEAYGDKVGAAEGDSPGYTGHVADSLTGLTYMQARFYDPVAGRFLSIDPVAAGIGNFNRYWYAANNPYSLIDPDGRYQSPPWLVSTVPGQASFDNAMTPIENGNYAQAVMYSGAMLAEQVLSVATLGVGNSTSTTAKVISNDAIAIAAAREASVAAQAAGAPGGATAGLVTRSGDVFTGASTRALGPGQATNQIIQNALDAVSPAARSAFHGCCAEINALSNAANAGADLGGSVMATVRAVGSGAGRITEACPSCKAVADMLGVKTIQ